MLQWNIFVYPRNCILNFKENVHEIVKMFSYKCSRVVEASICVFFFPESILAPSTTIMMPVVQKGRAKPPEILYNKLPTEGPAIPPTPKKKSSVPWNQFWLTNDYMKTYLLTIFIKHISTNNCV